MAETPQSTEQPPAAADQPAARSRRPRLRQGGTDPGLAPGKWSERIFVLVLVAVFAAGFIYFQEQKEYYVFRMLIFVTMITIVFTGLFRATGTLKSAEWTIGGAGAVFLITLLVITGAQPWRLMDIEKEMSHQKADGLETQLKDGNDRIVRLEAELLAAKDAAKARILEFSILRSKGLTKAPFSGLRVSYEDDERNEVTAIKRGEIHQIELAQMGASHFFTVQTSGGADGGNDVLAVYLNVDVPRIDLTLTGAFESQLIKWLDEARSPQQ